jgi:hypothetical protein
VLDEHLLEDATHALGAKTYSAAVNTAQAEVIRLKKIQQISHFYGSKIWEGNLADMRGDDPRRAE